MLSVNFILSVKFLTFTPLYSFVYVSFTSIFSCFSCSSCVGFTSSSVVISSLLFISGNSRFNILTNPLLEVDLLFLSIFSSVLLLFEFWTVFEIGIEIFIQDIKVCFFIELFC